MIKYVTGDIFKSDVEAIVNTVNTEGIMGKGLALQFKKRFPDNFKAYEKFCKDGLLFVGNMFIFPTNALSGPRYIINFPTKKSWKNKSKIEDIRQGLSSLVRDIQALKIHSIAIPPLGCGLGGLSWNEVKQAIEEAFTDQNQLEVLVYEPLAGKNPAPCTAKRPVQLTQCKAILLKVFEHYMEMAVATDISFVEAHKLSYLLQSCGIDMKLRFAPWRYGPYANNLCHVLGDMEGIWIQGFRDGTAKAFDTFCLLPAAQEAFGMRDAVSEAAFQKLDHLIEGFETPTGLELLGTVHWLITNDNVPADLPHITACISGWCENREGWGDRKARLFNDKAITMAIQRVTHYLNS